MQKLALRISYTALFLVIFTIICCSVQVFALDPRKSPTQYLVKSWQDQFPHNSVLTITQTTDGYIWFGTFEGLVRFDGSRFVVFDQTNSQLPHRGIISLLPDNENLWIGTIRGLSYLSKGNITSYTTKDGLINDSIYSIYKTQKGGLWIGTSNGLSFFQDGKFTNYTTREGLSSNFILSVKEDSLGKTWVATSNGLNLFENGKFILYGLKGSFIYDLFEDKDNTLWVASLSGLVKIQNNTFTYYTTKDGLSSNGIRQVKRDRDGNLWIGTIAGLNRFTNNQFTNLSSHQELSKEDVVISLFEDIEGNLWAGTHRGLNCIKNGKFFLKTTKDGLSNDYVRTILQSSKGGLWIGTGDGLNYLSDDGKISSFTTKDGLSLNNIRTLCEDSNRNLWIGTDGGGINKFKDGKFISYTTKDGLSSNTIQVILEDSEGSLWIGTYGGGLNKFKDGKFTSYTTKDGLINDVIRCLFIDEAGTLWIGTLGGINQLKDGKLTSFNEAIPNNKHIFSFFKDNQSNLWISSDEGLIRYKGGKFSLYTTKDGLFNNLGFSILEDSKNTLWISCNKGIYSIEKKELDDYDKGILKAIKCKAYDKLDGMRSSQCNGANQPASCKTKDGNLWFPTINGIVIINPQEITFNKLIPSVKIESIDINDKAINLYKKLSLSYGKEKIKFYFTCLSFIAPEKIKFKYKLDGFDQDWSKEETAREVSYTNLPPGNYKFNVIASNNDGLWNTVGDSYSFLIPPPWWMTWWAYGSYFFLASAVIFGLVRFQTEKVKQKAKITIEKEKEQSLLRETQLRAETAELKAKSIEIENTKKVEELAYARQLQLSMLPNENIFFDNIEIVGHMRTATEVGGDYYDFIQIDNYRYFLAIGDATGHGVGAGLVVGMVKALLVNTVNELKTNSFQPTLDITTTKIMTSINSSLRYLLTKKGIGMSLTIAIFDSKALTIEVCASGMPYPCLYKHQTKEVEVIELKSPPLGFFKEIKAPYKLINLKSGDKLLFTSDGFFERKNQENKIWGYHNLVNQIKNICSQNSNAQNIVQQLNYASDSFAQGVANSDDMTVLLLTLK